MMGPGGKGSVPISMARPGQFSMVIMLQMGI
jgi:hypothetical protein